jgi:hypothetical protein
MEPPSLHRRPVASLPLGTYKRRPGRASPHRTPHNPPFLLSRIGAHPHCVPSITTALPPSPGRFTTAPSPMRAPPTPSCPPLPLRPSQRPPVSFSACVPHSGGCATALLAAPMWSTVDRAPGVVHRPWTESIDYSILK